MIKVIIFDVDGVLIPEKRRFSLTLEKDYGISLEKSLEFFNGPFQECLVGNLDLKESIHPYLAKWGWSKGVEALLDIWFKLERDLDKELIKYVNELREEGVLCFLATNNEKHRFQYLLREVGLENTFDGAYSSASLGCKKPSNEFFQKIFDELKDVQKNEVLFVDDSAENIEGAKNFGINTEFYTSIENLKEKILFFNNN